MNTRILYYPSSFVGYLRLLLLAIAAAIHLWSVAPEGSALRYVFVVLLGVSRLMDVLDGYLARKLGQTSSFGALLDLTLDLLTHTLMWFASGFRFAVIPVMLEWVGALYTAPFLAGAGDHWKRLLTDQAPFPVRRYFHRNQANALSVGSNLGHFVFPMALYVGLPEVALYVALPGLLLYEAMTAYIVYTFARRLLVATD